jgi:hypothetical protein
MAARRCSRRGAVISDEVIGSAAYRWYRAALTWISYGSVPKSGGEALLYGVGLANDLGVAPQIVSDGLLLEGGHSNAVALSDAILEGLTR